MERLLDFSQPFDVSLLEQTVAIFLDAKHPGHQQAHEIIMQLRNNPNTWQVVDTILEKSQDKQTKFMGLQILEDVIKYRWKALSEEHRLGIRNYVVEKVITISQDENSLTASTQAFVVKLDLILVQILKQEWPHNWPTFISDMVGSSKTSESLCENNIKILKLLSEEVFDFSKEEMTQQKTTIMKEKLNEEFRQIFELSELILERSHRVSLISATLDMLLRYLSWIPLGFIFETGLIKMLLTRFFPVQNFRNQALSCITEIVGLTENVAPYEEILVRTYLEVVNRLTGDGGEAPLLPINLDIAQEFERVSDDDRSFVQRLSLFFTTFFAAHLRLTEENPQYHQSLLKGMHYLIQISKVDDQEIFKICLEYWNKFGGDLYKSECVPAAIPGNNILALTGPRMSSPRKILYAPILTQLRVVMISRMAKPEEVLVEVDDSGEIVRETTKDTDAIALYKTMRETLVYLAHLDYEDTENIMLAKLARQCSREGDEFTWNNINTLSWAIGSISGAMSEDDEKRFLVTVLKELLGLCEYVRGKDNKAVVATDIMYVVGQYPRFLRMHWRFLRTVVLKLFDFMHELHPGVRDMACDTFLKLAQKCRRKFVTVQLQDTQPFIDVLLGSLVTIMSDLEPHQIQTLYEACGVIIASQPDPVIRESLLRKLMELPNQQWYSIMQKAQVSLDVLQNPDKIKEIAKILRTNVKVCSSMGHFYIAQLGEIYRDMLNVYKVYSEYISSNVATHGKQVMSYQNIRSMRAVRTETLTLIETFVSKSEDPKTVSAQLLPYLRDTVLADYQRSIPDTREAGVLELYSTIVRVLKQYVDSSIPEILQATFLPTLEMISKNHIDYPEHRLNFYNLLSSINSNCFDSLFQIPPEMQKQVVDAIVWGFKHTERNIADVALEILSTLLDNMGRIPVVAQQFYRAFLIPLIEDILFVLTDRTHKSGFKMHSTILRHMLLLIEQNQVQVPLFDPSQVQQGLTNQLFIRQHVSSLILRAFPNVGEPVVRQLLTNILDPRLDLAAFKQALRDFLIQLKEFSAEDNAELFTEENEAVLESQRMRLREQQRAVPGVLNPFEVDDMADL